MAEDGSQVVYTGILHDAPTSSWAAGLLPQIAHSIYIQHIIYVCVCVFIVASSDTGRIAGGVLVIDTLHHAA